MKIRWFDRFLDKPEDLSCGCGEGCCGTGKAADDIERSEICSKDSAGPVEETGSPAFVLGKLNTPSGRIPLVSARLSWSERFGSWLVRWGIGRMSYTVPPGLFALGDPDPSSPVFVTANYKMSFDRLRSSLPGIDGWILVLDTKGINVWCAAGKGTFGTDELAGRIELTGLAGIVSHRNLILPQLGAPGVAAHEVVKRSGFKVIYGPVRSSDLPVFLEAGMKASARMRKVRFTLADRAILVPMELVGVLKHWAFLSLFGLWILSLLGVKFLAYDFPAVLGAVLVGAVLVPLLLPWLPGRPFAVKGWILGFIWAAAAFYLHSHPEMPAHGWAGFLSYIFVLPAISAFLAMNFTGASTVTSLSGVVKEMRNTVPLMLLSVFIGLVAFAAGIFARL